MFTELPHQQGGTLGQVEHPGSKRCALYFSNESQIAHRTTVYGLYQGIKLPPTISSIVERNTLSGAPSDRLKSHEEFQNRRTAKPLANIIQLAKKCRLPDLNQGQLDLQSSALPV